MTEPIFTINMDMKKVVEHVYSLTELATDTPLFKLACEVDRLYKQIEAFAEKERIDAIKAEVSKWESKINLLREDHKKQLHFIEGKIAEVQKGCPHRSFTLTKKVNAPDHSQCDDCGAIL